MAWATSFQSPVASLIFLAVAITDIAENDTTSPLANIYISLHESDPSAGNQTTGEGNYTNYARQAVARSASGWTDSGGTVTNDAEIAFPACGGGSDTASHVGCGTLVSTAGVLIIGGALSANLSISSGITPRFAISALSIDVA